MVDRPCSTRRRLSAWPWRLTAAAALAVALLPAATTYAMRSAHARKPARRSANEAFVARVARVVVRPGDTLWDLCARYTGKPWVWPQVWALNPQLTNPHWLQVGTVIDLRGGAPTQKLLAAARPGATDALAQPTGALPSSTAAVASSAPSSVSLPLPSSSPSSVDAPPRLRPNLRQAIVAHETLQGLPRVQRTLGESELAHLRQHLAVEAGTTAAVRTGEAYVTLAVRAEVPACADSPGGALLAVTGIVQPTVVDRRSEVVVVQLYGEIEGGQYLAPLADYVAPPQQPTAAPPDFVGRVTAVEEGALVAGGNKLAFVSAGRAAGLAPGMRLYLLDASGSQAPAGAVIAAPRAVGELRVLQVQQNHSTCAIVRAAHEVTRGQRIVGDAPGYKG